MRRASRPGPGRGASPELGHSCSALAMSVLAMFFSPARYSSLTDSNLGQRPEREVQHHPPTARPRAWLQFWKPQGAMGLELPTQRSGEMLGPPAVGPPYVLPQPSPGTPNLSRYT